MLPRARLWRSKATAKPYAEGQHDEAGNAEEKRLKDRNRKNVGKFQAWSGCSLGSPQGNRQEDQHGQQIQTAKP